jgi:hypothetical protein
MAGQLKRILDRVWPFSSSHHSPTSEQQEPASADGGIESQLYECPSCQQVYIAIDKKICLNCETEVEVVAHSERKPAGGE